MIIEGWLHNKRTAKGLVFLVLRDGSGFAQATVIEEKLGNEVVELAKSLSQESSVRVSGKVMPNEREELGVEIEVSQLDVISIAEEYPITPKEHGVDF